MAVDVRVLGPLELAVDGSGVELGGPRLRALLGLLVAADGRVVSLPAMVEALWGEHEPAAADRTARTYVSRLRGLLPPPAGELLVTRAPGYLLRLGRDAVDAGRFERLATEGRTALRAGQPAVAVDRLAAALGLWRGDAYGEFGGTAALAAEGARLERLRLAAVQDRIEAELARGAGAELVAELETLVGRHPGHEALWGQLMTALYRTGRQADALHAFRRARTGMVEAAGVEPSPALVELHGRLLAQDPRLLPATGAGQAAATAGRPAAVAPAVRPAQLPATVTAFAGRAAELAELDTALAEPTSAPDGTDGTDPRAAGSGPEAGGADLGAGGGGPAAAGTGPVLVPLWAVSGTAGVGKTTVALHWAHRVADRFPDGQLYVNLHGFDPVRPRRQPADVLRGFLDALGVRAEKVPADPEERAALYRSLLAGRRMLVVLDNARDAEQVRLLLPGAPGCLAIVTSRDRLTPLVTTAGARPLPLELPDDAEARELLARRLGADRLAAEPAAVDEIVARCARLPLALAVVAGRAATRPGVPLGTLAAELADAAGSAAAGNAAVGGATAGGATAGGATAGGARPGTGGAAADLDAFGGADPVTDVRSVLSWSYRALGAEAARLFRLLALHPGPDVAPAAAASLAGVPVPAARRTLAELAAANLAVEQRSGQFCRHDLLTAYAAERVAADETGPLRHAAERRVLAHYLHSAEAAAALLYGPRAAARAEPPGPDVAVSEFRTADDALAWFHAERGGLVAAVRQAAEGGSADLAEPLAWSAFTFLDRWGHRQDAVTVQRDALAAATRIGDERGRADAHRRLATAYLRLGRHDDAETQLREALALHVVLGDHAGQAHCHDVLSGLRRDQGRPADALGHSHRALELYRAAGHRAGEGEALNAIGWIQITLGDYRGALLHCGQALTLQREIGDRIGEASTHDSIGWAHHHLGDHDLALACYRRAIELHRRLGERHQEAEALVHVGQTQRAAGRPEAAGTAWRQALALLEELDSPDAEDVRAQLGALDRIRTAG